jgi:2-polyprenyl-3-methyl-5-hydroxy-6-metoxy-1,4-benzoquinol methylase
VTEEALRYEKVIDDHHPWRALATLVPAGATVLDVGCGSGMLATVLVERQCVVDGVEPNVERAAIAVTRMRHVAVAPAGPDADEALEASYDVVVFSDVIEHVTDARPMLRWAASKLGIGGIIVAMIPNSANFWCRWKMLRGDWGYESTGYFDIDHLRFFDLATAAAVGAQAGLREVDRMLIPAELPTRRLRHRRSWAARLTAWRPNLFAAHIVLVWSAQ